MGLRDDIARVALTPALLRTLADALRQVAAADGPPKPEELRTIRDILGDASFQGPPPEPMEALWAHADLFIRGCVAVALVDGDYGVEEARVVSSLAHRLGVSAHQLADLEKAAFEEFRAPNPTARQR